MYESTSQLRAAYRGIGASLRWREGAESDRLMSQCSSSLSVYWLSFPLCRSFPAVIHSESVFLTVTLAVLTGGSTSFCVHQPSGRQGQAGLSPASCPFRIVWFNKSQPSARVPGLVENSKSCPCILNPWRDSNPHLRRGPLAEKVKKDNRLIIVFSDLPTRRS